MGRWLNTLRQLAKPGAMTEFARRLDSTGWSNAVTGFGTDRDKTVYTTFAGPLLLGDEQLANLYHGDDLAARMVDIVPDEMLREGFSVDVGDPTLNAELAEKFEAIDANGKLADGKRWGRLFGGGAVLIGADDGRPAQLPLIPERANGISYLYAFDRRYLWPFTWYTEPGHPKLGKPETYLVTQASGHVTAANITIVHESRLLIFGGAKTGIREREANNGWDYSVMQRAFEALRSFNTGYKAVEVMLTDGNQAVFKMSGLAEQIGAKGEELAKLRMQTIDLYRSVLRAIVIDAGDDETGAGAEEFMRHSVQFGSVPDVLDKYILRLAAAVQVPVTILMGQSPAGMDATGESDFRWFYDRIRSEQRRELTPAIRYLTRIMLRTKELGGKTAEKRKIETKYPPLWSEPPSAEATRRKTVAETDAIYITNGVYLPEEVALARQQEGGSDGDITLDEASIAVRKAVLADELKRLEEDGPTPPAGNGMPPFAGGSGPPSGSTDANQPPPPPAGDEGTDPEDEEDAADES